MSGLPTYGSTTSTPTSDTGTFPGASVTSNDLQSQLQAISSEIQSWGTNPAGYFFSHFGVSSTEQGAYLNSDGTLNVLAAASLIYYEQATQAERQSIQDQMVTAGLISSSSATGLRTGTALSAFKDLIGTATAQGTDPMDWLDSNATPQNQIQEQISANLTAAQKALSAPETVNLENPTTLAATINQAFTQTLGFAPTEQQTQEFINGIQSQDATYANAPRAAAQAEINTAKSETAALDAMGPDDVDKVISAYQAAVSGTSLPGAGTTQGPANGASSAAAPEGHNFTGASDQVGANVQPTEQPSMGATKQVPQGLISSIMYSLRHNTFNVPDKAVPTSAMTAQQPALGTVPPLPNKMWGSSTYGGTYALSQADWTEAVKDYPPAAKYKTPGDAPQAIQQAAFTALLLKAYTANNNSWAAAVAAVASGTPFGQAKGVNVTQFGQQVASQVNAQIAALQNQVDTSSVTTKVTAPDAAAEANQAAKQSDPSGYEAAQTASWSEILNQMLQGSPTLYDQSTADTFTGPVGLGAATTPSTPVGANA